MVFVVGHSVWTFAIPIVLVEALTPRLAREPWLARPGLVIMTVLYGAAAALVVGVVSLVAAFGFNAVPTTWLGVAIGLAVLVVTVGLVGRLSRSRRWDARDAVRGVGPPRRSRPPHVSDRVSP